MTTYPRFNRLRQGLSFARVSVGTLILRSVSKEASRNYLLRSLGALPGLPAKASQLLSARLGDKGLVSHALLPIEQIKRAILESAPRLGCRILEIEKDGKAASLGQVHRVHLDDGRDLAIKVQIPGVSEAVSSQLGFLMRLFEEYAGRSASGLDTEAHRDCLETRFNDELDYRKELQNQQRFEHAARSIEGLIVPQVYPELSTVDVLAQDFEPADSLAETTVTSAQVRAACATRLLGVFFELLFGHGLVHADLHERNWGYRAESNTLVLYDFGSILILTPSQLEALKCLVERCSQRSANTAPNDFLCPLVELGFDALKLAPIADRLDAVCAAVFEPLLVPGDWNPGAWDLSRRLERILGPDRWYFRAAGPPWFLVLMRTALYLHRSLVRLGVHVSARQLLRDATPERVGAVGSNERLPLMELPEFRIPPLGSESRALRVQIKEAGDEIVSLELPHAAVQNLEDLVSDLTRAKIQAAGFDLKKIREASRAAGYPSGVLLDTHIGARHYRVWLG